MAAGKKGQTMKAQLTRASLVVAAAAILREEGPQAVTYRYVAKQAGAASSAVGYYYDSIDELLREAADYNFRLWAQRAEKAAEEAEALTPEEAHEHVVDLLLQACLPEDLVVPVAHYQQLMTASQSDVVTSAYSRGRKRLDDALQRILDRAGVKIQPRMVVIIVDGAAVNGISEGHPVRDNAAEYLALAIKDLEEA